MKKCLLIIIIIAFEAGSLNSAVNYVNSLKNCLFPCKYKSIPQAIDAYARNDSFRILLGVFDESTNIGNKKFLQVDDAKVSFIITNSKVASVKLMNDIVMRCSKGGNVGALNSDFGIFKNCVIRCCLYKYRDCQSKLISKYCLGKFTYYYVRWYNGDYLKDVFTDFTSLGCTNTRASIDKEFWPTNFQNYIGDQSLIETYGFHSDCGYYKGSDTPKIQFIFAPYNNQVLDVCTLHNLKYKIKFLIYNNIWRFK